MTERQDLLAAIVETTRDYRKGEIPAPTSDHVNRWVTQFNEDFQLPILHEMNHVLGNTYYSRERVLNFLHRLMKTTKLAGDRPCDFWKGVRFLDIQKGGNSQTEMLSLFADLLRDKCGVDINEPGEREDVFIYLDDAVFTGNRVRRDIEDWIANAAPDKAILHIVSIAIHSGGQYYANRHIKDAADAASKNITITWWRDIELEDRRSFSNQADVLRPTVIPDSPAVREFVDGMKYPPTLRLPGSIGKNSLYSGEEGKILLENEFLKVGAQIRKDCPGLGATQRPLGHMTLDTLGFGSLIVTFRNCPNNAPLALWVGEPWYPLFPRATNSDTAARKLVDFFSKSTD